MTAKSHTTSNRTFPRLALHAKQRHSGSKTSRPWNLNQSSIFFGDTVCSYTTTHQQSFCGRSMDGRPLVFHHRDPSFLSQHLTRLDLSTQPQSELRTHNQEVHGPKRIPVRIDSKEKNWARHCSGQAVREVTNPQGQCEYQTSYKTEHRYPRTDGSLHLTSGQPTQWHQHNILTGEVRQTASPRNPRRYSRDKQLWAARRWETDSSALRLY